MIKVLDCTLRDGGYYNNWDFSNELIQDYIYSMESTGVDYIEFGFRFTPKNKFLGGCAHSADTFIDSFVFEEITKVGVMLNASDYFENGEISTELLNYAFPQKAEFVKVQLVRVACHFDEFEKALPISNYLKELGYIVGFNIMQIGEKGLLEIKSAAKLAVGYPLEVLYFADSLGNLTPYKTKEIVKAIKSEWPGEIGIHTHDNMGNAIANTLAAIEEGVTWIDSTITGMGRGPGNAQTELMVLAIRDLWKGNDNLVDLFKVVNKWFKPMKEKFGWGTNPFYFLAGQYGIHPSYVQAMLEDNRYVEEDILAVIEYLKNIDSKSFRIKNLELGKNIYNTPIIGKWSPKLIFHNKEVLILGAGPGIAKHKDAIIKFIKKKQPIVLALNAKDQIPDELINYRLACHPIRVLSDAKNYKKFHQPIIMPKSALSQYLSEELKNKEVLDFGLAFVPDLFEFNESQCTVPTTLVAAYALAVANSGKASKIYLAGFDGYGKGDVRHAESEHVFATYLSLDHKAPIVSILNTTYNIPSTSIYTVV